jgi:phosphatidate cytidylyltransferase
VRAVRLEEGALDSLSRVAVRLGTIISALLYAAAVPMLSYFMLKDREKYAGALARILRKKGGRAATDFAVGVARVLSGYVLGELFVVLITACITTAGLLILHVPYSYVLGPLSGLCVLVPAWAALVQLHGEKPNGRLWTLFALVLVWAADTFAYFAGSRFGRNKLAPRISPGKTLEGVWGALIGTALVALIAGWWMQQRGAGLALLVGLAVLCVVFSIIGDLFESLMKRQAGVKDSGSLFPGHGGMLDRLDGVFAALPLFVIGKVGIDLLVAP